MPLFHPDLSYGAQAPRSPPAPGEPWRLLFLGRIMPYKGLGLFIETMEQLRASGLSIRPGVFGEGPIDGPAQSRLAALGARVVNRWLSPQEMADAFASHHAIVLSHTEASQSGVAAAAFGACLPAIATPVGGLAEQIRDGVTGTISTNVDAGSLAIAAQRLLAPERYAAICTNVRTGAESRSVARFVDALVRHAIQRP